MTRWHTQAGVVDVLHDIPAGERGERLDYAQLQPRAVAARGGAEATVLVAALDDIIASKEHADREKDREALPELYALARPGGRRCSPRTKRVTDLVAPIHADPEPRVRVEKEKLRDPRPYPSSSGLQAERDGAAARDGLTATDQTRQTLDTWARAADPSARRGTLVILCGF